MNAGETILDAAKRYRGFVDRVTRSGYSKGKAFQNQNIGKRVLMLTKCG